MKTIILIMVLFMFAAPAFGRPGVLAWEDAVQKTMDVPNKQGQLSTMTFISGNKAYMTIYDAISYQDKYFWNDIAVLENQTEIKNIDVMVNSYGGSSFVAFALVDMINRAEKDGFKFKAYGTGVIASAAIPIFLSFNERVASPGTLFMVHEGSSRLSGTTSQFQAHNVMIELLQDRYFDILILETKVKDRTKWKEWERDTEWFDAETAQERGLIQGIE